ncbi:MAG: hypothetical protein A2504_05455 [Bdellovibrionales bacterium RIFOXYD12_FULL_39_22]|nr:MAG: hypothetical protein A2385_06370 [Bdellovibrionales bacterium RIFOXYB1_FULL_39_21]OFZ41903.1 MAG: hypothetical protein A2485_08340 [Bdellovibrionales bacterium RIFOXYC12_FULL_39_17]OFZ50619.1 MAG: hypothetical protein A2404_05290 [Bdellovibrionales bacterium RIFOXYC1_FULL_39_130]OFZ77842.1 MAG: hypothetical protein A2560_00460 [Bdellovibrionales bacterium RIFOXYD1_FULL_39_84]OFZ93722.1 MAG: hypothetical protein A2504_05455 [Bdellovibrionales bacterium RIFOXYD12_FULL_39_22]HLE11594.1 re
MIAKYPLQVAVVDDDQDMLDIIKKHMAGDGIFEITTFINPEIALKEMAQKDFSIALIDIQMPQLPGDLLLKALHDLKKGMQIIIMTGHPSITNFHACFRSRANDFVLKPITKNSLYAALNRSKDNIDRWCAKLEELMRSKKQSRL